ncbi:MAG TPA: hypothetical protein VIX59_06120 [Candidatus Binataceae bacterium]
MPRGWFDPWSGWGSEILGPIEAVLNARSATQLGHDSIDAELLQNLDYLKGQSEPRSGCPDFVTVVPMVAEDDPGKPKRVRSLSWQLSSAESSAIEGDWRNDHVQKSLKVLNDCIDPSAR